MSAILEFADKLRAHVDIVDVIGKYVELRRLGTNHKGLCPFHNEKTPSFTVSGPKQIFHCFGCHEGGDVIKFFQKVERLEWMEAIRQLSKDYGLQMPEPRYSEQQTEQHKDAKTSALKAVELAATLYQDTLTKSIKSGQEISGYLEKRGLDAGIQKQFGLGLAPDGWTVLMDQALKSGFTKDNLFDAGLLIKHATKDRQYDRFRNRLMFPIQDQYGNVIAFGARVYASSASPDEPKYINSPETLAYHKGQALYALNLAKDEIVRSKQAILMEGYMDVIRAHASGVTNAIASCGTALTDEQAKLLKRFCGHVVFVYDGDEAGQKAMLRGAEILLGHGFTLSIVTLPGNHDPDSYLREFGSEQFQQLVSTSKNYFNHFADYAERQFDRTTPEGKVQIAELMLPLIRKIAQPIVRAEYARKLADRLQVDASLISAQLKENNPHSIDRIRNQMHQSSGPTDSIVEKTLLKLLIECNHTRPIIFESINPEWLRNPIVRKWFQLGSELQSEELCWDMVLRSTQVESESEVAFLRALAMEDASCDTSPRTIQNVAGRLSAHFRVEQSRSIEREITEFYHPECTEEEIENQVRKADDNAKALKNPTGQFFLRRNSSIKQD